MKVLFDTNVILDLMLDRTPFAEAIVTRNRSDFANSEIPVYSPEELAQALDSQAPDGGE